MLKGPTNEDEYEVGDWVLVQHGLLTRGVNIPMVKKSLNLEWLKLKVFRGLSEEKPA